jgi:LmbE family N-acetylglucosaminyl deacetylase
MTQNRWDISGVRTNEARRAAAVIGATYHCLDERDGLVVYDKPTVQKAIDLFRRVNPALVFTHAQDDYMMDHVEVSKLARAASFVFGAPNISAFPLLPGSKIPHLYYCDPIEGIDSLGRPARPTTVVDVSAQHGKKLEMLACHASQREWLRAHHGMDEYLDAMRRHAEMRGRRAGVRFGEAFVQHRGHAYPREDLLATLFPAGPAGG